MTCLSIYFVWHISLSIFHDLSIYLSFMTYLSIFYDLSIYLLWPIYLSFMICLSIYLYIYWITWQALSVITWRWYQRSLLFPTKMIGIVPLLLSYNTRSKVIQMPKQDNWFSHNLLHILEYKVKGHNYAHQEIGMIKLSFIS